jgi:hypothetical protein
MYQVSWVTPDADEHAVSAVLARIPEAASAHARTVRCCRLRWSVTLIDRLPCDACHSGVPPSERFVTQRLLGSAPVSGIG